MSRESKLSILGSLLARVRQRATAPRVAAHAVSSPAPRPASAPPPAPSSPPPPSSSAVMSAGSTGTAPQRDEPLEIALASEPPPPRRPSTSSEPPLASFGAPASEPPPDLESEEGPPSAPRLREDLVERADEGERDEADYPEDEVPIKTPPPESGRQHVAPVAAPSADTDAGVDLDMEISITVTETTPSPTPPEVSDEGPPSVRVPATAEFAGEPGPMPRLAFVSEPEIELHVRTPAAPPPPPLEPAASEAAPQSSVVTVPSAPKPPSIPTPAAKPPSVPAAAPRAPSAPPPAARAPSAPPPAAKAPSVPTPSDRPAPPVAQPAERAPSAPPIRMMAQPLSEATTAAVPVEVWASTHAPSALRGQVASFVGQNATFVPKSFGELLDASLGLGEDQR